MAKTPEEKAAEAAAKEEAKAQKKAEAEAAAAEAKAKADAEAEEARAKAEAEAEAAKAREEAEAQAAEEARRREAEAQAAAEAAAAQAEPEALHPVLVLPVKFRHQRGVLTYPHAVRGQTDFLVVQGREYAVEGVQFNPHKGREEAILAEITVLSESDLEALVAAGWTPED